MPAKIKAEPNSSQDHSGCLWNGITSDSLVSTDEPALQHKKRVDGPPTSLSINFHTDHSKHAYDDFALLGKQDKFASNVKYPTRQSRPCKTLPLDKDVNANSNVDTTNDNKNNSNAPPPAKQIKIDEFQQQNVQRKLDLRPSTTSKADERSNYIKENLTPSSPPLAPRKAKQREGREGQELKKGLRDKNLSDILPKAKIKKGTMNENVQTNLAKGVALSAPEASADYSLQYKAGIAQPRVNRKLTEYQKEFNWKKGFSASPILSAEQMVYNSAPISPVKNAVIYNKSEYQRQFKSYPLPEPLSLAPKQSQEEPQQRGRLRFRGRKQGSKSVGDRLSPDHLLAAGIDSVTNGGDPRLILESRDSSPVPKVPIPYGSLKRSVSEYRANFRSPQAYRYNRGTWKDAFPPQLFSNKESVKKAESEESVKKAEEPVPLSNWYAEVLELRRRAGEYKKRSEGTHFSREHLVQLLAKQADYWDMDSEASARSLEALDLELANHQAARRLRQKQGLEDKQPAARINGELVDRSGNNMAAQARKKGEKGNKKSKMAWELKKPRQDNLNFNENCAEDNSPCHDAECQADLNDAEEGEPNQSVEVGRLPTPVLRQSTQRHYRHHLDRTTPSIGGLLLSSPPEPLVPLSDRSDRILEAGTNAVTNLDDSRQLQESLESSPKIKFNTNKLVTSPILGKPTSDTHSLRDEDAESDHVMQTQYISHPSVPLDKVDRNLRALQRRMNANIPPTIDERMGATYSKAVNNFQAKDLPLRKPGNSADDDALSVSAMSIASSSSLASEVYERARKRKDDFWGKSK